MRELANAIRELASAIRETASFTELEFVPCEEERFASEDDVSAEDGSATGDSGERVAGSDSEGAGDESSASATNTVLPLTPRGEVGESDLDSLCRPGGCGCREPEDGRGRHARRDSDFSGAVGTVGTVHPIAVADSGADVTLISDVPSGCCQSTSTVTR